MGGFYTYKTVKKNGGVYAWKTQKTKTGGLYKQKTHKMKNGVFIFVENTENEIGLFL